MPAQPEIVLGDGPPAELIETGAPSALRWTQARGLRAVLARPDHYVFGGAGDAVGVARLVARLEEGLSAAG